MLVSFCLWDEEAMLKVWAGGIGFGECGTEIWRVGFDGSEQVEAYRCEDLEEP